jgi:hypothetical protein
MNKARKKYDFFANLSEAFPYKILEKKVGGGLPLL